MLSTMFKMANVTAILFINVHVGYKGETWQWVHLYFEVRIASHRVKWRDLSNAI